jgi:hypothetical protein
MKSDPQTFRPIEDPEIVLNLLVNAITNKERDLKFLRDSNTELLNQINENSRLISIHENEIDRLHRAIVTHETVEFLKKM